MEAVPSLSKWELFTSRPKTLTGTHPRVFEIERRFGQLLPESARSNEDAKGRKESLREALTYLKGHKLQLFLLGVKKLYVLIQSINNLLLLPLFTMLAIEIFHDAVPEHVEVGGLDLLFTITFFSEWFIGLLLARRPLVYLGNLWLLIDVVSCMPDMLGQLFRSFRTVRLLRMLKLMNLFKLSRLDLRLSRLVQAFGIAASAVLAGAIAIHRIEPQTVDGMNDSLWWSLVTLSTVGYGDITPESSTGRLVGGILIIVGLGMFSYFTGVVSAVVTDPDEEAIKADLKDVQSELVVIKEQLQRIEAALTKRESSQ